MTEQKKCQHPQDREYEFDTNSGRWCGVCGGAQSHSDPAWMFPDVNPEGLTPGAIHLVCANCGDALDVCEPTGDTSTGRTEVHPCCVCSSQQWEDGREVGWEDGQEALKDPQ